MNFQTGGMGCRQTSALSSNHEPTLPLRHLFSQCAQFLGAWGGPSHKQLLRLRSMGHMAGPAPHSLLSQSCCPLVGQGRGDSPRQLVTEGGWSSTAVAPAVLMSPPLYTIPLAFLSLSPLSLSLFPVSPTLPLPPAPAPLSCLCPRPASGPRGLCFTPLVAHRAEEAADPWYSTACGAGWGTALQEGQERTSLAPHGPSWP